MVVVKKKKSSVKTKVVTDKQCADCGKALKELWEKWYTVDREGKPVCHCEKCFDKKVRVKRMTPRIKMVQDNI